MLSLAHRQYLHTFNNEMLKMYGNVSTQISSLFSTQMWSLNRPTNNDTLTPLDLEFKYNSILFTLTNLWIILGIVSQVLIVFRMVHHLHFFPFPWKVMVTLGSFFLLSAPLVDAFVIVMAVVHYDQKKQNGRQKDEFEIMVKKASYFTSSLRAAQVFLMDMPALLTGAMIRGSITGIFNDMNEYVVLGFYIDFIITNQVLKRGAYVSRTHHISASTLIVSVYVITEGF